MRRGTEGEGNGELGGREAEVGRWIGRKGREAGGRVRKMGR